MPTGERTRPTAGGKAKTKEGKKYIKSKRPRGPDYTSTEPASNAVVWPINP